MVDQTGWAAVQNIKAKAPDLFGRHGLDDDTFIDKHILPTLNATETKAQLYEGKWKYSKPLAALSIRMQATRLVAEMKGLVLKEQENAACGSIVGLRANPLLWRLCAVYVLKDIAGTI